MSEQAVQRVPVVIVGAGPTGSHRRHAARAVRRRLPGAGPLERRLPAAACRAPGRRDLPHRRPPRHRRRIRRDLAARASACGCSTTNDARARRVPSRHRASGNGFPQANMFDQPESRGRCCAPTSSATRAPSFAATSRSPPSRTVPMDARGSPSPTAPTAPSTSSTPTTCWAATAPTASSAPRSVRPCATCGSNSAGSWSTSRTDADLDQWEGVHQVCDPVRAGTYMRIGETRYRWEFRLLPGETAADFASLAALRPLIAPWVDRHAEEDELELVRVTEYTFRAQTRRQMATRQRLPARRRRPPHPAVHRPGHGRRPARRDEPVVEAGRRACRRPPSRRSGQLRAGAKATRPRMIRLALDVGRSMTAGGEFGNLIRRVVVPRLHRPRACAARSSTAPRRHCAARRWSTDHVASGRLAGTLCPNPLLADGRRLDATLGRGFAIISAVPLSPEQRAALEQRGAALHIAEAGSELAAWLQRGRATAAIVRPDRTRHAGGATDRRAVRCNAPSFRLDEGERSMTHQSA